MSRLNLNAVFVVNPGEGGWSWNHSSLELNICWGSWSTYVSTALVSHKDANLMSHQLKKHLENNAAWENTTKWIKQEVRCWCVGGAAERRRRRFGSSFEVSPSSCFHWVFIDNTTRLIRSVQLWKSPDSPQLVLIKKNENIFISARTFLMF